MRMLAGCLAVVLLAAVPAPPADGRASAICEHAIRLGLVAGSAAELETASVSHEAWAEILAEAFGAWHIPIPACAAGKEQRPVAAEEASARLESLVRTVRGKLGLSGLASLQGIRFLVRSPAVIRRVRRSLGSGELSYPAGLELVRYLLEVLPCPRATPDPVQAVDRYYNSLAAMTSSRPSAGGPPVCGLAAANLERNAAVLRAVAGPGGVCFAVASREIESLRREGMLAEVVVYRRMVTIIGQHRSEDSGRDTFRLRLGPGGWLIYE